MTKSPISPAGRAKMLAEIDHLVRVERPRVSAEVQWAASLGDRSENSEYIYGKQRMRDIDRRWRYLTDRVEVVRPIRERGGDHVPALGGWSAPARRATRWPRWRASSRMSGCGSSFSV